MHCRYEKNDTESDCRYGLAQIQLQNECYVWKCRNGVNEICGPYIECAQHLWCNNDICVGCEGYKCMEKKSVYRKRQPTKWQWTSNSDVHEPDNQQFDLQRYQKPIELNQLLKNLLYFSDDENSNDAY